MDRPLICSPEQNGDFASPLRHLWFLVIPDSYDANPIFAGGGVPVLPSLRGSDCLVSSRFNPRRAVGHSSTHVMTRDIRTVRTPERLGIAIAGVHGDAAEVEAFDPETDQPAQCVIRQRGIVRLTGRLRHPTCCKS